MLPVFTFPITISPFIKSLTEAITHGAICANCTHVFAHMNNDKALRKAMLEYFMRKELTLSKKHMYKQDYVESAQILYGAYTTPTSENLLSRLLTDTLDYPAEYEDSGLSARAFLNNFILRHYPNEMAIKTSFVDNVLLKQGKTNVAVFELSVGKSRVDICKINGGSAAFEIKTDLDNFTRLERQLANYYEIFECVSVIISESRWQFLPDYVPAYCGIYSYRQRKDGKCNFILRRAPIKQFAFDSHKQLSIVSKSALAHKASACTSLSTTEIIDQCLAMYDRDEINRFFKNYLRQRYGKHWEFLREHNADIYEIDYEWFFRNNLEPAIIY